MKLPIGYDNFRSLIENRLDFVDKTLFIQEVLDDITTQVAVITRPRRFGKTLNLSMLHHFLAAETYGQPTQGLFNNLKIMQAGEQYMQHQGQYPVIFITFKDVKDGNFEHAYAKLCELLIRTFDQHQALATSDRLTENQRILYRTIIHREASQAQYENALQILCECLFQHYGVKPWLLIDEYDTPLQSSYVNGYYDEMVSLMRGLFGSALKTNPYLQKAVITGILRVAKESLFSGLNNLKVYSFLNKKYGEYFGFTEAEVNQLLKQARLENHAHEIKQWYNGYQAGDIVVYNPWSIVNCIVEEGLIQPYWVNTSDNQLIRNLLVRSSTEFKEQFERLLQDQPIEHLIDENTVFVDLQKNESAAWSLLFMAGYLKVLSHQRVSDGLRCTLDIPNIEVKNLYRQIIKQWLANGHGIEWYNTFLNHLLSGNLEHFERELHDLMEQTVSSHDTSRDPEAFYHGLMIGLTASLYHSSNYEIQSNRESGYGRYDYLIFSRDKNKPTLLLEFKKVTASKNNKHAEQLEVQLEQAAREAVQQMVQQNYLAEAKKRGATQILKIGLAFCGKRFKIYYE